MADQEFKISASPRTILGKKNKNLRKEGKVPGVVYGSEIDSTPIVLDTKEFVTLYKKAGESNIIDLLIEGEKSSMKVLVKDLDINYAKQKLLHVSFYKVNMKQEIDTIVPLEFVGFSLAEKDGSVLVRNFTEVEVRCLPANLPDHIDVDITSLMKIGDSISFADLKLPEGVKLKKEDEELSQSIINATAPITEEQEAAMLAEGGSPVAEVEVTEQSDVVTEETVEK